MTVTNTSCLWPELSSQLPHCYQAAFISLPSANLRLQALFLNARPGAAYDFRSRQRRSLPAHLQREGNGIASGRTGRLQNYLPPLTKRYVGGCPD